MPPIVAPAVVLNTVPSKISSPKLFTVFGAPGNLAPLNQTAVHATSPIVTKSFLDPGTTSLTILFSAVYLSLANLFGSRNI